MVVKAIRNIYVVKYKEEQNKLFFHREIYCSNILEC